MIRIILFIMIGINLCAVEIRDNIGIFTGESRKEFEERAEKIEKKSGLNFIFEYDFAKKVINLKDNKNTILFEIIKKDNRETEVNLYVSNDLNIAEEILDKAVNNRKESYRKWKIQRLFI